ncbi:MAG TPA: tetratricopeptide repeat protein, partial [Candidatus Baltobacteraceae bacterium]|nr:tetratricopeptide repeat protein [Candidatus Baltobacteraceae bacterium]
LQTGAEVANDFSGGVWFVELAPLADSALVVEAVAALFDVREAPDRKLIDSVVHALRAKNVLVILDNCEHLIAAAGNLVRAVLGGCPHVKVVATSREAFGIPGEQLYRMPSLAVPPESERGLTARAALSYGAVALFVQRASAVQRVFELDDRNAPIVAGICRQLDGIALAIELAAAKVAVLSPRQVSERLSERFRLLTGGDRTVLPRQQTMRAAIDWSYELLSAPERTVLQRLSVFSDGCTLEAAAAICRDERVAEWDVLELLSSLAAKSLMLVERTDDAPRYGMLQSTREYALEKLSESGECDRVTRAHAEFFLTFALRGEAEYPVTSDAEWYGRYEPELGNYRAVLTRTLNAGEDLATGVALAAAMMPLWRGPFRAEGRRWLNVAQTALERVSDPLLRAKTLHATAWLGSSGRERLLAAERAVAAFRALDDPPGLSRALEINALTLALSGRPDDALPLAQEGLALAQQIGASRTIAWSLDACGTIRQLRGDLKEARVLHERALEVSGKLDTPRQRAAFLCNLAEVEFELGDARRALALASEARELYRRFDDRYGESLLDCNVAAYSIALDSFDAARQSAHSAVLALRDQEQPLHLAMGLEHLAVIAGLSGAFERAARLCAYTDRKRSDLEIPRQKTEQTGYDRLLAALERDASLAERQRWREEGAQLSEDAALALALGE